MDRRATIQISAGVLVVVITCALGFFVLEGKASKPAMVVFSVGSPVLAGFISGARAKKPVQQAALAGALAYLLMTIIELWVPDSEYDTPGGLTAIAICGIVLMTGFGGLVAAAVLPHRATEPEKESGPHPG